MQPIDRPFRFTKDFCVVWLLLVVPTYFLTRGHDFGPWYSQAALLVLAPLFATFVVYGPVLLVRQVIQSGARGGFVARVALSIVGVLALVAVGFWASGLYTETRGSMLGFGFAAAASIYLNWRLKEAKPSGTT